MPIKATAAVRVFNYNGAALPDPKPGATPEQVRDLYSATYPELTTAEVEGLETVNGQLHYKFIRSVGTKG